MAEVIAGAAMSHVPAVGAAMDNGKTTEPYWAPYFDKVEGLRAWMAEAKPDVCIVIYNDHASAFSLQLIPTFALGVAADDDDGGGTALGEESRRGLAKPLRAARDDAHLAGEGEQLRRRRAHPR